MMQSRAPGASRASHALKEVAKSKRLPRPRVKLYQELGRDIEEISRQWLGFGRVTLDGSVASGTAGLRADADYTLRSGPRERISVPGRPRLVQQLEKGLTARGWVVDKLQIRRKAVTGRGIGRRVLNGFATLIGFASAPADSQYSDDELLQGNVARHAEKNLKFDLVFERANWGSLVAAEATEGMYPLPEVVCLTVVLFKQLQKTSTGEKADTGFAKLKGCLLEALVYSKHDELLRAKSSDYPCLLTLVLAVLDVFLPHKEDGHDRSLEALLPLIRKQVKRPMKEGKVLKVPIGDFMTKGDFQNARNTSTNIYKGMLRLVSVADKLTDDQLQQRLEALFAPKPRPAKQPPADSIQPAVGVQAKPAATTVPSSAAPVVADTVEALLPLTEQDLACSPDGLMSQLLSDVAMLSPEAVLAELAVPAVPRAVGAAAAQAAAHPAAGPAGTAAGPSKAVGSAGNGGAGSSSSSMWGLLGTAWQQLTSAIRAAAEKAAAVAAAVTAPLQAATKAVLPIVSAAASQAAKLQDDSTKPSSATAAKPAGRLSVGTAKRPLSAESTSAVGQGSTAASAPPQPASPQQPTAPGSGAAAQGPGRGPVHGSNTGSKTRTQAATAAAGPAGSVGGAAATQPGAYVAAPTQPGAAAPAVPPAAGTAQPATCPVRPAGPARPLATAAPPAVTPAANNGPRTFLTFNELLAQLTAQGLIPTQPPPNTRSSPPTPAGPQPSTPAPPTPAAAQPSPPAPPAPPPPLPPAVVMAMAQQVSDDDPRHKRLSDEDLRRLEIESQRVNKHAWIPKE